MRDPALPDRYTATAVWEHALGASRKTDVTVNGAVNFYRQKPSVDAGQLKSVDFTAQLDHPLGPAFLVPQTTLTLAGRFSVFPALVGLSLVVFGMVRTPAPPIGSRAEYHGYAWGFCLAAVFTLWGATGQLATLVYAIRELRATPAFPPGLQIVRLLIASGLLPGVLVYGVVAVRQIVDAASAPAPAPDIKPAEPTKPSTQPTARG